MAENVQTRFGKRLRKLRQDHAMTQVELADKLGISRSYLADVERGNRNISIVNLEVIADGFGLSLAQLLSRI